MAKTRQRRWLVAISLALISAGLFLAANSNPSRFTLSPHALRRGQTVYEVGRLVWRSRPSGLDHIDGLAHRIGADAMKQSHILVIVTLVGLALIADRAEADRRLRCTVEKQADSAPKLAA